MFCGLENFSPAEIEKKVLEFWRKNRIYEKSLEKTKKGKSFTFYDGPPFATGLPHYGHILASTIKDVIPRYQTMRGRFVRRRWGWDCHGLPIEEVVERQLGVSGKKQIEKIGIEKFNETCRSKVLEYAAEWKKMVERIARWIDFDNSYKTMDRDYMESVWWAFKKIYDKKLVYEGRKVLLYCPRCETPVSNFEVAMDNSYKDVSEEAVTVKFRIKEGQKIGNWPVPQNTYLLAWTTTPWTLPGNVALAVGENIDYALVLVNGENYILAEPLIGKVFRDKNPTIKKTLMGNKLIGLEYESLFNVPKAKTIKSFRVYTADFVTTEEGTGIVHTAVVYGEDDYNLGVKIGLPVVPLLDEKGKFNNDVPKLIRGTYFKDSEKAIKDDLAIRHLLFARESHVHPYPFCWRCGTTLFYNAIPAWFINVQKIKPQLTKSNIREINWFPAHLKRGRYEKSVEAAPDWNISRNRYWGNPIPVWTCERCNHKEVAGSLAELDKLAGGSKNKYWVMRHGQAETQLLKIADDGRGKYHLTPKGRREAENSAKKLKKEKIDLIVASPILRTKETAGIVAKILDKKIIFDSRLREYGVGDISGQPVSVYDRAFPTYEEQFIRAPQGQGGETLMQVQARLWELMKELEEKYKGKRILLISHEYPIWLLAAVCAGWTRELTIAEKIKRGDDFINVGESQKLPFIVGPRNRNGESDLHRPYIDEVVLKCHECGGKARRVPEIFDSWTEAGSMPFAEYHYPFENKKVFENRLPAQFVAEYIAQTRAWFYVMHVISFILFGKAPFENVVTTGTILAEDGSKMSKSKGNFPDPWEVIEKHGVDALRFYLMNSVVMQADNLNFSVKDVEIANRKIVMILWNVYKYFETYAEEKSKISARGGSAFGGKSQKPKVGDVLDRWIGARTQELIRGVTEGLDKYDTVRATRVIAEYVEDLSTWYLRRSRKRSDQGFFKTLHECLLTTSKIIAPFMPYLAEVLYLNLIGHSKKSLPQSVHLEEWPVVGKEQRAKSKLLLEQMAEIRRLASLALAKRAEAGIKVRQPLASLKIKNQKSKFKINEESLRIVADEINVKEIIFDSKVKDEVELDTKITPELKEEGILRELGRAIQGLRQNAKLRPQDKIVLMLELPPNLAEIVLSNETKLKREVGAKEIKHRKSGKFTAELETKLEEAPIWLGVRKI